MARPPNAPKMIDSLSGPPEAKARLEAIVATLSGGKSVPEACAELGIGEARFHEMRKEFLASSLGLLERKTAGRKPADPPVDMEERLAELEDENRTLRVELEASHIRTELALTMPHLLKRHAGDARAAASAPAPAGTGMGMPGQNNAAKKKKRRR